MTKQLVRCLAAAALLVGPLAPQVVAQPPPDFSIAILSGSNGPWGLNETLMIDSVGAAVFFQSDFEVGTVDSAATVLSPSDWGAIYDTLLAVDFFNLDTLYDGNVTDGSAVTISVLSGGLRHTVEVITMDVLPVARVVRYLNDLLGPDGITLSYGAFSE